MDRERGSVHTGEDGHVDVKEVDARGPVVPQAVDKVDRRAAGFNNIPVQERKSKGEQRVNIRPSTDNMPCPASTKNTNISASSKLIQNATKQTLDIQLLHMSAPLFRTFRCTRPPCTLQS